MLSYAKATDLTLVDLWEGVDDDDDDGIPNEGDEGYGVRTLASLPVAALLHGWRRLRPWPDDRIGFKVHFALTPCFTGDTATLVRTLWNGYRFAGLPDRLSMFNESTKELFRREYMTRYPPGTRHPRPPDNFMARLDTSPPPMPFEKGSGCDPSTHSVLVAHVASAHAALWLMRRFAGRMDIRLYFGQEETTVKPVLLLPSPGGATYTVIAAHIPPAWPLLEAMVWCQLPVWQQGTRYATSTANIPDFLTDKVHVLPPGIPPFQPDAVDGKPRDRYVPAPMLGDVGTLGVEATVIPDPQRPPAGQPHLPVGSAPNLSAAPRSPFRARDYILKAYRTYLPATNMMTPLEGPLALESLLEVKQHLAQADDRVTSETRRAPAKRKHDVVEAQGAGKRRRMTLSEYFVVQVHPPQYVGCPTTPPTSKLIPSNARAMKMTMIIATS